MPKNPIICVLGRLGTVGTWGTVKNLEWNLKALGDTHVSHADPSGWVYGLGFRVLGGPWDVVTGLYL